MRTPPPPPPKQQAVSSTTPAAEDKRPPPAPVGASLSSADLPLKSKKFAGGCRQYACSEVSSDGSKWKKALQKNEGLASRGLLANDLTYANNCTPGVCVLRQQSLPVIPPPAGQEARVKFLKKAILHNEKVDARARRAFVETKKMLAKAAAGPAVEGGDAGASSEVLPKHQRLTAGKPAICRPIPQGSREAISKMMNAEDSHFTSEYRCHGWWKMVAESQKHELKEHVRPLDGWTAFRDRAAEVNKCARFPINTY